MPAFLLAWLDQAPLLFVGAVLLGLMSAAAAIGYGIRVQRDAVLRADKTERDNSAEGYIVSATLGLLALLLGFTFSLAVQRFETRRELVVADANAIGTAYLRVQLLSEPHRSRLSGLLTGLVSNKIELATVRPKNTAPLLAKEDRLLTDIWSATAAAFDSIRTAPYSYAVLEPINNMIDMDGSRRAARAAHVPTVVLAVLLFYLIGTAGVLGFVLAAGRAQLAASFLLVLLTLSLLLVIDIDRPTIGGIRESQEPMQRLLKSLKSQPPSVYDRWRTAAVPR
jgi:hypothetical protein